MANSKVIDRLNELYQKSKETPLSEAELVERDKLRQEYLAMIRGRVKAALENIEITDEAGNIIKPEHPHSHKKD